MLHTPLKNIADHDHTDIRSKFFDLLVQPYHAGFNRLLHISLDRHDRIRSLRADRSVERLVFGVIIFRHKLHTKLPAVFYIIQIDLDDPFLHPADVIRNLQQVRLDLWLVLDIIRQQVILCLKMVVKAAVRHAGFLTYIFNRQRLVSALLEDPLRRLEDLLLCLPRFLLLFGHL